MKRFIRGVPGRVIVLSLIGSTAVLVGIVPATFAAGTAGSADVSVDVTAPPESSVLTYTAVVSNAGPDQATSVALAATLPAGTEPIKIESDQGTCSFGPPGAASCALGSITSGSSVNVSITVYPVTTGTKTLSATVSAAETDPVPGNNADSDSVTVNGVGIAQLAVTLDDSPDPGQIKKKLTYTAQVTNIGDDGGAGVFLSGVLPSGLKFLSATSSTGSGCSLPPAIVCHLGSLNPSQTSTVTIVVKPKGTTGHFIYFSVGVGETVMDPSTDDNSASVRTWVNPAS
jgi:uncharacterized repeat protein (TIGR01451 family)